MTSTLSQNNISKCRELVAANLALLITRKYSFEGKYEVKSDGSVYNVETDDNEYDAISGFRYEWPNAIVVASQNDALSIYNLMCELNALRTLEKLVQSKEKVKSAMLDLMFDKTKAYACRDNCENEQTNIGVDAIICEIVEEINDLLDNVRMQLPILRQE